MNIKDLDCSEFIYETLYPKKLPEKCCKNCKYRNLYSSIWARKWNQNNLVQDNTYICTYYDDFYHQNPVLDNYICGHWKER